jgi:2-keto-4-pentenoate hydratase/2-oxohepta-3-ene-1,7-dioic acid hydratase in catechol pathway
LQSKAKEKGLPWALAKGFDGSAPVSDFQEIGSRNLGDLNFRLEVNGDERQKGNTSLMLFSFDYIISYLSKFFTLKTGDMIFTGTPSGVGPIRQGDRLTGFIEEQKLLDFEVR